MRELGGDRGSAADDVLAGLGVRGVIRERRDRLARLAARERVQSVCQASRDHDYGVGAFPSAIAFTIAATRSAAVVLPSRR